MALCAQSGANQRIPMELALKVASKIREGVRFAVYVVIPMWPEGDSTSAAMQEMLFFQVTSPNLQIRRYNKHRLESPWRL